METKYIFPLLPNMHTNLTLYRFIVQAAKIMTREIFLTPYLDEGQKGPLEHRNGH